MRGTTSSLVLNNLCPLQKLVQVRVTSRIINQDPPAISGKAVVDAISASVEELSYSSKHMVSRAYHDSTFMAQVRREGRDAGRLPVSVRVWTHFDNIPARCSPVIGTHLVGAACDSLDPPTPHPIHQVAPTAMVFVPCHNGWSHRPDEHATPEDIERGVRVLALTLVRLAGAASGEHSEL